MSLNDLDRNSLEVDDYNTRERKKVADTLALRSVMFLKKRLAAAVQGFEGLISSQLKPGEQELDITDAKFAAESVVSVANPESRRNYLWENRYLPQAEYVDSTSEVNPLLAGTKALERSWDFRDNELHHVEQFAYTSVSGREKKRALYKGSLIVAVDGRKQEFICMYGDKDRIAGIKNFYNGKLIGERKAEYNAQGFRVAEVGTEYDQAGQLIRRERIFLRDCETNVDLNPKNELARKRPYFIMRTIDVLDSETGKMKRIFSKSRQLVGNALEARLGIYHEDNQLDYNTGLINLISADVNDLSLLDEVQRLSFMHLNMSGSSDNRKANFEAKSRENRANLAAIWQRQRFEDADE